MSCLTLATWWAVAHQAPLSIGFSRKEDWSGLPFPSLKDLPDPGIEPSLLHCRLILYPCPMLMTDLPTHISSGPSYWFFLSKGLWGVCLSTGILVTNEPPWCQLPCNWPSISPSTWGQWLPPCPAHHPPHMMGSCSRILLQTCKLAHPTDVSVAVPRLFLWS